MNIKIQRTNSDIQRVLTIALTQKLGNPMLSSVHILQVETSADLSVARVHVDITSEEPDKVMAELSSAAGFLRNEIAKSVKLRRAPELRFIRDVGRANAMRVEELLAQIKGENN